MAPTTQREKLNDLALDRGIITTREVEKAGIHRQELSRLVRKGVLERVERGRYRHADAEISEHHGLVAATAAAPGAVVCLLSALSFFEIGTQLPSRVWLALERGTRKPRVEWPPVRFVSFSDRSFHEGIETHQLEGRDIRIYSIAKTLADLFKFRNKIGLDVALEALRDSWRDGRVSMEEIERHARTCRVDRIMAPYLESLIA